MRRDKVVQAVVEAMQAEGRQRLGTLLEQHGALTMAVLCTLHDEHHLTRAQWMQFVGDLPVRLTDAPVAERFVQRAKLGSGAMGLVHLVEDVRLGRAVAVKTLEEARDARSERIQRHRFAHEARITAQLSHPGIVAVHDADLGSDELSYAMALVRGQTLKSLIRQAKSTGDPPLIRRLVIFLDVCDAVHYAHGRGVLHRDLKPDNVMVGAHGQVVVVDWGIALTIGSEDAQHLFDEPDSDEETGLTGGALGTASYMSPEQAHGNTASLTAASDQYALALILQELVTLTRARKGRTSMQTLFMAMQGERANVVPASRPTRIPRELVAILDKACSVQVEARYDSVGDLADDVRRFLADEPVLARRDTLVQRMGRTIARHRQATLVVMLSLWIAVLTVALVGGTASVVLLEQSRVAAEQREHRLTALQRTVRDQAEGIQQELQAVEGLLRGVAGAAEVSLAGPVPDVHVFRAADFAEPSTAPRDLSPSLVYGGLASLDAPDVVVSYGVDEQRMAGEMARMAAVGPNLRRAVVGSLGAHGMSDGVLHHHLRNKAAPLVWAYAATANGVMVGYPGTGFYPDDYDPRTRPWYTTAERADDIVWSALDADESGLGLLLTCATPLRDPRGDRVGVAAVDLTFGHIIEDLLHPPPGATEAWLIDADGHVIVRSSQRDTARKAPANWRPPPFPHPEVLARIQAPGGHIEAQFDGQPQLVLWHRIDRMGWTYLVHGPLRDLESSQP